MHVPRKLFISAIKKVHGKMLDAKSAAFATSLLKSYYKRADIRVDAVPEREFGFGNFENKIAFRHQAFGDLASLKKYMSDNAPAFCDASSSLYAYPDARPMEKKQWKGSPLVFDLDASDLHLDCQKRHGSAWVCQNCLDEVKHETVKLIEEFLIPDFGFSKDEIEVNFSGNRGYHVHVNSKEMFALDSKQRRGISEYISGANMDIKRFFPTMGQKGTRLTGPKPSDYGWGGKLARGLISALNEGEGSLERLGIDPKIAKKLMAQKADIVFGITTGNWDKINIQKKAEFWNGVMQKMSISQSDSIDRNVTNDVYHLVRLPDTIHGGSGLLAKRIGSPSNLDAFDPMRKAVAFRGGVVTLHIGAAPEFSIVGETFGPYENAVVELPTAAALYLVLKRLGEIT